MKVANDSLAVAKRDGRSGREKLILMLRRHSDRAFLEFRVPTIPSWRPTNKLSSSQANQTRCGFADEVDERG